MTMAIYVRSLLFGLKTHIVLRSILFVIKVLIKIGDTKAQESRERSTYQRNNLRRFHLRFSTSAHFISTQ